ncbi:MAG TPA: hypothetical protein VGK25_07760, partial [Ignavibacteria bacterium]
MRYIIILFFIFAATVFSQDKGKFPEKSQANNRSFLDTAGKYNAEQIIEMSKPALVSIWYHTDNYYSYYTYSYTDTTLLNGSGFIFS